MTYAVFASLVANGVFFWLWRRTDREAKKLYAAYVAAEEHANELERAYNMIKMEAEDMLRASYNYDSGGGVVAALERGDF